MRTSLNLRAFPGFETFSESYSYLPINVTAGEEKIYFLSCELALVGVSPVTSKCTTRGRILFSWRGGYLGPVPYGAGFWL